MWTLDQNKAAILCRLAELDCQGREPVLQVSMPPTDEAIRAIAELEIDGVIVFDEDSLCCRLTGQGAVVAAAMLEMKRSAKMRQRRPRR